VFIAAAWLESEESVFAIRLLHAKSWQVGGIDRVLNLAREGGGHPFITCFPARGLPQSGSKGLSQSLRFSFAKLGNTPSESARSGTAQIVEGFPG
jgi:hypothetical protein